MDRPKGEFELLREYGANHDQIVRYRALRLSVPAEHGAAFKMFLKHNVKKRNIDQTLSLIERYWATY